MLWGIEAQGSFIFEQGKGMDLKKTTTNTTLPTMLKPQIPHQTKKARKAPLTQQPRFRS